MSEPDDRPEIQPGTTIGDSIKHAERHKTVRCVVICVFILIGIAMVLPAALKMAEMAEQPPWMTILLAIFGPTGTLVVLFGLYLRYLSDKNARLNARVDTFLPLDDEE